MRKRAFRPVAGEALEDRSVPSASGIGALNGTSTASVPAQDAAKVIQAYANFERTYGQDVFSVLLKGNNGTTDPAANRTAFDAAVGTAIGQLNTDIDSATSNLPTATALQAQIQGELLGTDPTTLQAQLAAAKTPTDVGLGSVLPFLRTVSTDIFNSSMQVANQVRSAQAPAPPAGTVSQSTIQADLSAINGAFQTFKSAYSTALTSMPPATNRAAFDSAVGTALTTLNSSVGSALSNLPSSLQTTLSAKVQADLLGTGNGSLQARLASLRTPRGTSGLSTLIFRIGSGIDIALAQGRVARDVTTAIRQYNNSLTTTTTTTTMA